MSVPTKAEQWWEDRVHAFPLGKGWSNDAVKWEATQAFQAGQAENEASRPAAPTLLDIAKRLRDEFPGVHTRFSMATEARANGELQHIVRIWSPETGDIYDSATFDDAIARLRQARDGDANPADLPGADMRIDLAQPTD